MCERIQAIRIAIFVVIGVIIVTMALAMEWHGRKRGIDMKSSESFFEICRSVSKPFSRLILLGSCGVVVLFVSLFVLTLWGKTQGCMFPTRNGGTW